jgi:hypothetical protein
MSEESFLRRWSRRKQQPEEQEAARPQTPPSSGRWEGEKAARAKASDTVGEQANRSGEVGRSGTLPPDRESEEPVEPEHLPPIESLGADSDYTVFLKAGVPEALRVAALRKLWVSDPLIRDFRHPAEYAWDFTTSEFDLRPGDDVTKILDSIFGNENQPTIEQVPAAGAAEPQKAPPRIAEAPRSTEIERPASEKEWADEPQPAPKHGGATPA